VSIIVVVALCSISDMGNFYLVARPTWMLYAVLLVLWLFSFKVVTYGIFSRTTFYTPLMLPSTRGWPGAKTGQ